MAARLQLIHAPQFLQLQALAFLPWRLQL